MDMLNLSANERLDLADLSYATFDSQIGLHRAITGQVMMDASAAAPAYILSGFAVSNPSGTQVTVTKGVALLPYRTDTQVLYGMVATEGPTTQTLDLSTRAAGTYTVYITFSYQPGATDTRTLWTNDNGGAEYASAVPTRQVAGWQLVVETASPGAEWVPIATVTTPSMAIVDMRPFYFEGRPDQSFVPQWGATADRATTRATNPVTNLQTFVQAMQQCLIDIKGPGIANWYTPYIAGQTIGYKGTAKAASTAWYDANFYAQGDANNPRHVYSSDGATLAYARGLNAFTVTGGTAATSTTLNFAAPGTALGTKGGYSLVAGPNTFALADTANGNNPLVYTPASETMDLSSGGLGTVILPPTTAIKYSTPTPVVSYLPILEAKLLTGLILYPVGPTGSNTSITTANGQIALGALSGSYASGPATTVVMPIRLPAACTLTQIEYTYYTSPQVGCVALLMKKANPNLTPVTPTGGTSPTSGSTTGTPATIVSQRNLSSTYYTNSSGGNVYCYNSIDVTLNTAVSASDTTTFYVQLDFYPASSTQNTTDTLSTVGFFLDYIRVAYTMPGPGFGGR